MIRMFRDYLGVGWQWLAGAALWVMFYGWMLEMVFEFTWNVALLESLIANLHIVTFAFLSYKSVTYYQPGRDRVWFLLLLAAAFGVAAMLLYGLVASMVTGLWAHPGQLEKLRFFHGGFAFLAHGAAIWLAMQKKESKEQQAVNIRQAEAERLTREAELLKLRHQLQPHFLFNSLNSINALIMSNPEQARSMVHQLSTFLRGTIKAEGEKTIALQAELEYMQLYLDIEKVRCGHRLNTRVEASEESRQAQLPSLLLQPLMENAIKFGLYGTTGEVEITMKADVQDGVLLVEVSNPVDGDAESQTGTGFGLSSIRRRLYLLYGRNDLLQTERSETLFTATIKIPQSS